MKRKVLLSSILSIALCLSLIVGSTYALFTSESKVNVAITSGTVDVVAVLKDGSLKAFSGQWNETLNAYESVEVSADNATEKTFANGGTVVAGTNNNVLTIDKITPMDKVTFVIAVTNNSNVAIQYQTVISALATTASENGTTLLDGLKVTIDGVDATKVGNTAVTEWSHDFAEGETKEISVEIELPERAGNEYRGLSAEISYAVTAVQGNAHVEFARSAEQLNDLLAAGGNIILASDIDLAGATVKVPAGVTATLDLNGKTLSSTCGANQNMLSVANNAKLVIDDSVGTGKITYAGNDSTGFIVGAEGNVVMKAGTLEMTGTWGIGYAVDTRTNAWGGTYTASTFTMDGGKIVTAENSGAGAVRVTSSAIANYPGASVAFVMNGGEINVDKDGVFVQVWQPTVEPMKVTINGGSIQSDLHVIRVYVNSVMNNAVEIALSSDATLTYTGTEEEVYLLDDALICYGGAATAEDILAQTTITIDNVEQ